MQRSDNGYNTDYYHTVQVSKQYRRVTKSSKGHLPPHIFAIAGSAYQEMIRENKDQVRYWHHHSFQRFSLVLCYIW